MSEAVKVEAEIDSPEDDVRRAIEELNIQSDPQPNVVIDKSSAQPERARDDEGKFTKAPKDAKVERKVLTLPEKPKAEEVETAPAQEPVVPPAADYPKGWPQREDLKAQWNDLPPWAKKEILGREEFIVKGLSKQDDERSFGRKVNEIVMPYLPTIRAEGGTPEKAIQDLLQTAHTLRQGTPQQKAGVVAAVVRQFGVSPQDLFSILQGASVQPGQPQQPGQPFNPIIETLNQRLDRIERERQEEIRQRQLQEKSEIESQIEEFAKAPGHEHFELVRPLMGHLLESGQATSFDDAYEKAIWATPEIRDSLVAAKVSAASGQRLTEQQTIAARAKSASGSLKGGPGGIKPNGSMGSVGSIEDDLRAALREHSGRV